MGLGADGGAGCAVGAGGRVDAAAGAAEAADAAVDASGVAAAAAGADGAGAGGHACGRAGAGGDGAGGVGADGAGLAPFVERALAATDRQQSSYATADFVPAAHCPLSGTDALVVGACFCEAAAAAVVVVRIAVLPAAAVEHHCPVHQAAPRASSSLERARIEIDFEMLAAAAAAADGCVHWWRSLRRKSRPDCLSL